MNSWDVFTLIYSMVATPLLASVDAMMGAMSNYIAPVLRVALIVLVAGTMLWKMLDPGQELLSELTKTLLLGGIALYMVSSAANYGPWARDILLISLPREVGGALAGSVGARPITGVVFGEIWEKAFSASLVVWRNVSWWDGNMFTVGGAILLYWLAALIATTLAFVIWLKAFIFLALLVGVGPLFAGLWIFPLTRPMAYGWFHAVMAAVVLQILVVALLALLLTSVSQLLAQLATAGLGGRSNEIMQVKTLLSATVMFGLAGFLAYFLPTLAGSITGGFAGYAGSATRQIRSMGGSLATAMGYNNPAPQPTQHVRSVQVPVRSMPAPGRSLSN